MTVYQLKHPDTAFSVQRQRRPRVKDGSHLAFIRQTWCAICGAANPDPAHIRSANARYGKKETGGGEKPDDRWVVPLCRKHHDEQHAAGDELAWWAAHHIDPFTLALALHAATGQDDTALTILNEYRRTR